MSDWIEQENSRAQKLVTTGKTMNNNAPRLQIYNKKAASPKRYAKSIFIQDSHSRAFDHLAFNQKMMKKKNAPELAEEAIELLLKRYGEELKLET